MLLEGEERRDLRRWKKGRRRGDTCVKRAPLFDLPTTHHQERKRPLTTFSNKSRKPLTSSSSPALE